MVRFAAHSIRGKVAAIAAVVGSGALLVGCGQPAFQSALTQPQSTSSVTCEPNQRAVVRQVLVNGVPQSQISCESIGVSSLAPVATTGYAQPVQPIADTRFVPANQVVTREIAPERVAYQRAPERRVVSQPKRSVGTSALIIGSSAAGGAGLGALLGGKKGAGIGAIAGGGAAALWDQITRHKQ